MATLPHSITPFLSPAFFPMFFWFSSCWFPCLCASSCSPVSPHVNKTKTFPGQRRDDGDRLRLGSSLGNQKDTENITTHTHASASRFRKGKGRLVNPFFFPFFISLSRRDLGQWTWISQIKVKVSVKGRAIGDGRIRMIK